MTQDQLEGGLRSAQRHSCGRHPRHSDRPSLSSGPHILEWSPGSRADGTGCCSVTMCIQSGVIFMKFMAPINLWCVTVHCTIIKCSIKCCFTFLTVLLLLPNTNQLRLDRCGQTGLATFCSALNDVVHKVQKVHRHTLSFSTPSQKIHPTLMVITFTCVSIATCVPPPSDWQV